MPARSPKNPHCLRSKHSHANVSENPKPKIVARQQKNLQRCSRPRRGVIKPGSIPHQLRRLSDLLIGEPALLQRRDQTTLPDLPVLHTQITPRLRSRKKHFLAGLFAFYIPSSYELLQRISRDMRVLDIQYEADIGNLLAPLAMAHMVQQRNFDRSHVLVARR